VEFSVPANAGQLLRVKMNETQDAHFRYDEVKGALFSVKARLPGTGSPELDAGAEDCYSTTWLYTLPQTGTYQVVFDRGGERLGIAFALLDNSDPVAGPGIKPEQVSVDFGVFAQGQLAAIPYNLECGVGDSWPSHLGMKNRGFEFRIMPLTGYKAIFKQDRGMELLEAALQKRVKDASAVGLPYPGYGDSALNLATQPRFFQGDGWRGLRWIGAFGQDVSCGFALDGQDSAYVFEGLSDDGRFFILMRAAISNPAVGRQLNQDCVTALDATPKRNIDELFKKDMPAIFERDMAAADPASFQPNLDQLDAVIRSLKLKP
jgi:hypothetical protein